jgi:hypothetical protein
MFSQNKNGFSRGGDFPSTAKAASFCDPSNYGLKPDLASSSMVAVMVTMMTMSLSKSGSTQQHNEGEQQSLFHAVIITLFCNKRGLLFWVMQPPQ